MKKPLFILLCWFFGNFSIQAQTWEWVHTYDYGMQDIPTGFSLDQSGNIYMVSYQHYASGTWSTYTNFLSKYDGSGSLLWIDTIHNHLKHSVTDQSGNTYIAGSGRIVKYDTNGNLLWDYPINAPTIGDISISSTGKIQVSAYGFVSGLVTTNIISLKEDGSISWSDMRDSAASKYCTNDPFGNLYVTAEIFVDSFTGNHADLVKYDSTGNLLFRKVISHYPTSLAVDKYSNIYTTGWIGNAQPVNINGTFYTCPDPPSSAPNCFLIKYDAIGNIEWYKIFGRGYSCILVSDPEGYIYLSGSSGSSFTIDSISLSSAYPFQFIVKLDTVGNIVWETHTVNNTSHSHIIPVSILSDSASNIFVTGSLQKPHYFGALTASSELYYRDTYIAKLSQSPPTNIPLPFLANIEFSLSPNPTGGVLQISYAPVSTVKDLKLKVRNAEGKLVYQLDLKNISGPFQRFIDLSSFPKGIYMVELEADGAKAGKKAVLQ